jgi:hypothetical protein
MSKHLSPICRRDASNARKLFMLMQQATTNQHSPLSISKIASRSFDLKNVCQEIEQPADGNDSRMHRWSC